MKYTSGKTSDEFFINNDATELDKIGMKSRITGRNNIFSEGYSNSLDDLDKFKRKKQIFLKNTSTWNDKHKPKKSSDLAVHPKKIEEIRNWLSNALNVCSTKNKGVNSLILLISGPPGCGKTATIKTLSNELCCAIQEWSNPTSVTDGRNCDGDLFESEYIHHVAKDDSIPYETHISAFRNFMLRSNRYSMLPGLGKRPKVTHAPGNDDQTDGERKIVIIEELPAFAYKNISEFQDIIKQYDRSRVTRFPLVIIQSECKSAGSKDDLFRKVFPPDFLQLANIQHIQFNAVNATNMLKTLTSIAMIESSSSDKMFKIPDKDSLQALATSVNGDIRAAVNALQFACLNYSSSNDMKTCFNGHTTLTSSTSNSKPKNLNCNKNKTSKIEDTSLSKIGGKDPTIDLFHAIGKVLYCKREEDKAGNESKVRDNEKLPRRLQNMKGSMTYARSKLKINPEELLEHIPMSSPASFTAFLHHSYLDFSAGIHEVAEAAESLSYADPFFNEWMTTSKISLTDYGGIITIRGLCHPNSNSTKRNIGMKKFNKPELYNVIATTKNRHELLSHHFRKRCLPSQELLTVLAPIVTQVYPDQFTPDIIEATRYYSDLRDASPYLRISAENCKKTVCNSESKDSDSDESQADMLIEDFDD